MMKLIRTLTAFVAFFIASAVGWTDEPINDEPPRDRETSGPFQFALSRIDLPAQDETRSTVQKLVLSADGRMVASRDSHWRTMVWDVESGNRISMIAQSDDRADEMVFSRDGQLLLTAAPVTSDSIRCWNAATGLPVGEIAHAGQILQVLDGQMVQAIGAQERIQFQLPSGPIVNTTLLRGTHNATPLQLSSDGRFLLISVRDERDFEGHLELYDLQRHERRIIDAMEHEPTSAVVGREGSLVAAVHRQGTLIHAWISPPTDGTVYLAGHRDVVQALSLTPDEMFLISGGADGMLRIWDLLAHRSVAVIMFEGRQINSLDVSDDGNRLAVGFVGDNSPAIAMWDLADLLQENSGSPGRQFKNIDDAMLALGGEDGHFAMAYLLKNMNHALPVLEANLRRELTPLDESTVRQCLADLDNREYRVRDRAYQALFAHRFQIRQQLQEAYERRVSVTTRLSLRRLLQQEAQPSIVQLPKLHELLRTVYLLERQASDRARALLSLLQNGHTDQRIRDAANSAQQRLQSIHPLAAVTDNS